MGLQCASGCMTLRDGGFGVIVCCLIVPNELSALLADIDYEA